jgi:tetratricopeptide (TPR) repeat protein
VFASFQQEAGVLARRIQDHEALAFVCIGKSFQTNDWRELAAIFDEAVLHARAIGDSFLEAHMLLMKGDRLRSSGELEQAEQTYSESVQLYKQAGDREMIGNPLGNLGRIAFLRGHYTRAQAAFEESIALFRDQHNRRGLANWLLQLALVALYRGDDDNARAALRECILLYRDLGNHAGVADCFVIAAGLAIAKQQDEPAVMLLSAATTILQRYHLYHQVLDTQMGDEYKKQMAAVQVRVDQEAFTTAWLRGQLLTIEQAIALVG